MMTYIKGRIKSFNNASRGIIQLFKRQQNARLQLLALVIVAALDLLRS